MKLRLLYKLFVVKQLLLIGSCTNVGLDIASTTAESDGP